MGTAVNPLVIPGIQPLRIIKTLMHATPLSAALPAQLDADFLFDQRKSVKSVAKNPFVQIMSMYLRAEKAGIFSAKKSSVINIELPALSGGEKSCHCERSVAISAPAFSDREKSLPVTALFWRERFPLPSRPAGFVQRAGCSSSTWRSSSGLLRPGRA